MTEATILWRRLDVPGHDACRLDRSATGWSLEGTAVFRHVDGRRGDGAALLAYSVGCDLLWRTRRGRVRGWLAGQPVDFRIARTKAGAWSLNGAAVPGLEGCLDLDLGFTPATNLFQLRRLALKPGQAADAPVAWLDATADTLERLLQRYERRADTEYWYESPGFGYTALLETGPAGFILRYPGLWEAER